MENTSAQTAIPRVSEGKGKAYQDHASVRTHHILYFQTPTWCHILINLILIQRLCLLEQEKYSEFSADVGGEDEGLEDERKEHSESTFIGILLLNRDHLD